MKNALRGLVAILFALLLAACGGGGDSAVYAGDEEGDTTPPVIIKPAPGALGQAPADPAPIEAGKPCKAPQASESGIENGKPPVNRCAA